MKVEAVITIQLLHCVMLDIHLTKDVAVSMVRPAIGYKVVNCDLDWFVVNLLDICSFFHLDHVHRFHQWCLT